MILNYIFKSPDTKLRAQAMITAVFEGENQTLEDYKPGDTITISDSFPAFFTFDTEVLKQGPLSWRIESKRLGYAFFNKKIAVVEVGRRAEQLYNETIAIAAQLPEQPGGVFMPRAIP